jgi:hypothetical protein
MGRRIDLNTLDSSERQQLVDLMLQYITDDVVAQHPTLVHDGELLFIHHRQYIGDMEAFLAANGGEQFVPLPKWDPATPIPSEFNVVKDEDPVARPPLENLNPSMPLPPEYRFPVLCDFESGEELGDSINPWHGGVHIAVGGTMRMFDVASAAPIFWCWHAFLDDVYWDWQSCMGAPPDKQPPQKPEEDKKRYREGYKKLYVKTCKARYEKYHKSRDQHDENMPEHGHDEEGHTRTQRQKRTS